jgi:hypothetical protein
MVSELREATWKDRLLYFLGRRLAFRIEGESMWPTIDDGDTVLVKRSLSAREGDIVLAKHPYKSSVKIVKRVAEVLPDGALILLGDRILWLHRWLDHGKVRNGEIEFMWGAIDCNIIEKLRIISKKKP